MKNRNFNLDASSIQKIVFGGSKMKSNAEILMGKVDNVLDRYGLALESHTFSDVFRDQHLKINEKIDTFVGIFETYLGKPKSQALARDLQSLALEEANFEKVIQSGLYFEEKDEEGSKEEPETSSEPEEPEESEPNDDDDGAPKEPSEIDFDSYATDEKIEMIRNIIASVEEDEFQDFMDQVSEVISEYESSGEDESSASTGGEEELELDESGSAEEEI